MTREIQRRLKVLGYDPGAVDGYTMTQTWEAICAFQRDHGITSIVLAECPTCYRSKRYPNCPISPAFVRVLREKTGVPPEPVDMQPDEKPALLTCEGSGGIYNYKSSSWEDSWPEIFTIEVYKREGKVLVVNQEARVFTLMACNFATTAITCGEYAGFTFDLDRIDMTARMEYERYEDKQRRINARCKFLADSPRF